MSGPVTRLEQLLDERKVIICCGSGGVGKTTTSASIALAAALAGRRAVVCTIDPARRLANSLGLTELGNEVVEVAPERLRAAGVEPKGRLFALMLDTKGTFDRLIERYAKDEDKRRRILQNKFYQQMSSTVVGSSDYMAMEKLYELFEEGRFDLIVLDTPPTKHALDFLQAPKRMTDAFDENMLQVFLKPWAEAGMKSLGFLGRALGKLVTKVDELIGLKFVEDFADFFRAFEGMYEGFRARAGRVDALLREPFTSFVVVTSPQPLPLAEAGFFCDRLRELEMRLDAVVVNRVQPSAVEGDGPREDVRARLRAKGPHEVEREAEAAARAAGDAPALLGAALRAFVDQELHAAGDRLRIEGLAQGPGKGVLVREVPSFSRDVHDIDGLRRLVEELFPSVIEGGARVPQVTP
ncbi:MAG: ArsA family ATPase [Planctomycetota bacterium]|nr:ArsA family ATPase [Planctomycetota bacterium]